MLYLFLIKESLLYAFNSLISNKLRTFLSLLGITIGIFAIISVFTVIDALQTSIKESIATLGDNMVYVQKWPWAFNDPDYAWWKYMKRPVPTLYEAQEMERRSKFAAAVTFGVGTRKTVQYKDNYAEDISISAFTHDYEKIRNFEIGKGRYFSPFESKNGKNCAVLGYEIATKLFQNENPIGKEIEILGRKVRVIGVFRKEGEDMFNVSNDNQIIIPINFARNLLDLRNQRLGAFIMVKAKNNIAVEELMYELRGIMRSIRRLKPRQEDNFALNRSSLISQGFEQLFGVIDVTGIIIGGFAILVGSFGIANIMFVSVKEQTHIIGIQKALGAKNFFILLQFLFEAITLCLIGGIIGLVLIYIGTLIVGSITDMTFHLTIGNIMVGVIISVCAGIIAGIVPASNASRLNPVEAINAV